MQDIKQQDILSATIENPIIIPSENMPKPNEVIIFLHQQTSLAYELGRKEMKEEVLKEIEEMKMEDDFPDVQIYYDLALDDLKDRLINNKDINYENTFR